MKKKRGVQRSHDRCKGEGEGGEVANGHMTVGAGGGRRRGGKGPVSPPLWARWALHSGPARPTILGPLGSPFWVHPACHPWASPARHLGPSGLPNIKPVGWSQALKKIKFRPGPTH